MDHLGMLRERWIASLQDVGADAENYVRMKNAPNLRQLRQSVFDLQIAQRAYFDYGLPPEPEPGQQFFE